MSFRVDVIEHTRVTTQEATQGLRVRVEGVEENPTTSRRHGKDLESKDFRLRGDVGCLAEYKPRVYRHLTNMDTAQKLAGRDIN
ncbi:hypothetical protein CTI12_AA483080 [Artemisia annua]|uniref:Uncharacterized protein n=1 Tax=Artemisia annua TaxID=35608 RepID=A0A2U1LKW9_ARTAN|nr:hypothetical protein CTI12_AA483080 [Artemisia annua]